MTASTLSNRTALVIFLLISLTTIDAKEIIHTSNLHSGDIIFWRETNSPDRSGHVAVVVNTSKMNVKDIKIAHATDNPKYNAFVKTHILPSAKIATNGKEYTVIRLKDLKLVELLVKILNQWLDTKIIFDKKMELLMNKWDDSLVTYNTSTKVELHHLMFEHMQTKLTYASPKQGMCTEIIIKALQLSFHTLYNKIPRSLQLDPGLCPPSTMMVSLMQDHENFYLLGNLFVGHYTKMKEDN